MTQSIPRPEYPRPDFQRECWQSLNGSWQFSFDEPTFDRSILVPFCYQAKASGIGDPTDHETVWYRRTFQLDQLANGRLLLHFGAVDEHARVWLNGTFLGEHHGGYTPFHFDITDIAQKGENELTVCANDACNADKPRGKQSWTGEKFGCWYTPVTGIWQSVWLESAGDIYLKRIKITPDLVSLQASCDIFLSSYEKARVTLTATLTTPKGTQELGIVTAFCNQGYGKAIFAFQDMDIRREDLIWKPDHPNLIDVKAIVEHAEAPDCVQTYFGLRDVGVHGPVLTLNDEHCFQRLILDQGYWTDTLLTPPSDEAIIEDIRLTKEMGFNGARKHQKIEDPRYYYWADKLGLLVWGELPSAYQFTDRAMVSSSQTMTEFIERDFNHPCIVAWVPINESWGVRNVYKNQQQQDYSRALYYQVKALDPTRLVSGNDGWEQTEATDICAIHDYALLPSSVSKYDNLDKLLDTYAEWRFLFTETCNYEGQPIVMTEYGGIAFSDGKGWGYYENVTDEASFLKRLEPITDLLTQSGKFSGFCYTQLTDVMQEVNGLLTEDRKPKVSIERLNAIFSRREVPIYALNQE